MKRFAEIRPEQLTILEGIKKHSEELLGHSPRFKYFTLHGKEHIENMLDILELFLKTDIVLTNHELFYLLVSICVHDLGMVVPLKEKTVEELFRGQTQVSDDAAVERYIRNYHNDLINTYMEENFNFLSSLGLSAADCSLVKDISRSHRKTDLASLSGFSSYLGALLRIIDELDVGPRRAPTQVLVNNYKEMDGTSCWHWFKHNIVLPWHEGNNVSIVKEERLTKIVFEVVVTPPQAGSIDYWLNQVIRPIDKVLFDEYVQKIIRDRYSIQIEVKKSHANSKVNILSDEWLRIEEKALSHNRKVILVVDDEIRKLEDLFVPLMRDYHVLFAPHARDGLERLKATSIDLVIIDMQVGSGGIFTSDETEDYKVTGALLCDLVKKEYPETKIGVLTGTRYESELDKKGIEFFLRKPVDPEEFEEILYAVLSK